MNTVQIKGAYSKVFEFLKTGGDMFSNKDDNLILKKYYKSMLEEKNSYHTIIKKLRYCYLLEAYLISIDKSFKSMKREDILNYFDECSKLSWSYMSQDLNKSYICLFINWAYNNKIIKFTKSSVIPKIIWHKRSNIRSFYSKDELKKILDIINISTNKGKTEFLVISLVCYLGLRVGDILNMKLSDINFNNNTINIVQQKTKVELTLPLIDEIKYPLLDYLKNVRPDTNECNYLFISKNPPYKKLEKFEGHGLFISKYLRRSKIDINGRQKGFHSLRHSFATSMLDNGIDFYSISALMGHEDLDTTMLYANVDLNKLKDLVLEVPYVK